MPYQWDPDSGRYRTDDGRFVRDAVVLAALDQVIGKLSDSAAAQTQSLVDGIVTLAVWQLQMMQSIKTIHVVGLALANGGWLQLDQADFGWIGQRIRVQYEFLARFSQQVAAGEQKLDGTAVARARMYMEAARATHREAQRRLARARGMAYEKNILGHADHCRGCLRETRLGWQPLGSLVPCGNRDCLSHCHCVLIYREQAAA